MTSRMNAHMNWVGGYHSRAEGSIPNTWVANYNLRSLMEQDLIDRAAGEDFLDAGGLVDFHWEVTWADDFEMPDEMLVDRIADVQGYVIFVHGWTGNRYIWEDLPGMVVDSNRQLVGISVDHNGFGESLFKDHTPALDDCNPPAAMRTLTRFINLINVRRQRGSSKNKVINFVGHSMGGATLFYLHPMDWSYGEVTRLAIAPALLLEDETKRLFYTTLGLGIGILQRLPVLELVERVVKPRVLSTLVSGSSSSVKAMHDVQYNDTPRGITGAALMAMGRLNDDAIARDFSTMRVMLGHRDPLVGLVAMMDLLGKLEFPAKQIHVVPGTHYMFSIGNESPSNAYLHAQAREMVVEDILAMHQTAVDMQKQGWIVG